MRPRTVPFRSPLQLGALIRDVRTERGWTQAELATRSTVGRQWLVSVERGRRSGAEIGMILRVLNTLGVELFARSDAGDSPPDRPLSSTPVAPPRSGVDLDSLLAGMSGPDDA